jgi:DNA-binding NarL/FixJ family response regulator
MREPAAALEMTDGAADAHVRRILRKLGVRPPAEAADAAASLRSAAG